MSRTRFARSGTTGARRAVSTGGLAAEACRPDRRPWGGKTLEVLIRAAVPTRDLAEATHAVRRGHAFSLPTGPSELEATKPEHRPARRRRTVCDGPAPPAVFEATGETVVKPTLRRAWSRE